MDEQRIQVYLELIEQLLGCPQGQEEVLLQANAALVDTGLVVMMEQYAAYLESQGEGNAGWLRGFAAQLGRTLEPGGTHSDGTEAAERFLLKILQLVSESQGNPQQVYPVWEQQQAQFNADLLVVMPNVVVRLFEQSVDQKVSIAADLVNFGNRIQQFPLGQRWLNQELGIAAYELALQVYTRAAFPADWAMTQNNLANAYSDRIRGERAENIEQAIAAYQLALQVYTHQAFPEDWAMTQNNLANAYSDRIRGERAENIEQAIAAYQLALQVYTCQAFPENWAMTQNNLAIAYSARIRGERAENIEQAIAAYQLALQVYTRQAFPENWAMTQNNLANAYKERIRGERAENIEQAIAAYQLALQVYTRQAFPENWAMTQNNLASAYSDRIRGERAENIEQAIAAYQLALQVRTRQAFPEKWTMTQNNLANAYKERIRGERAENIEQAITAYQLALQVYTRQAFPENWAMTQNNLASAYSDRIRGERAENIEQAITAYQLALQVYTRQAFPENWAMTQNNLANAYKERIRGERAENIEQAIAAYQLALQVYTRQAFPENWAMTQNNLAIAYSDRIRGERAENIEQAIAACQLALQVYTRQAFPEKWTMTQNNLANAYSDRIRGERAENIEQAISAYQLALQVRTRQAFPEDWAGTQNNLASAYSDRIRGERAENIEQAISAYQLALQVYTRQAFPENWAMTQNNLANAYSDRIRGERAENIEQAIAAYQLALQVYTRQTFPEDWAGTQNNLASAYSDRIRGDRAENLKQAINAYELALQVRTRQAFPQDCRQTARNLGNLHFKQRNWQSALTAYTEALAAAEILYQSCILLDGKAAELADTADLPRRVAYALVQTGNLALALETLEQGRARGLSESLDRDRANLDQLQQHNPNLYSQYKDITAQLRNLENQQRDRATSSDRHSLTPEAMRENAIALRQQLNTLIEAIRQVPGYENFLTLPTFEDLRRAVQRDRPLVYLVPTWAGSLALIVTPEDIQSVLLDDLTEKKLRTILLDWFGAYDQSQSDRQGWFNAIDSVTRQLWEPLMALIITTLKTLGYDRATLIPTGYLSLLPLHAAWTEDPTKPTGRRYALDDLHFTYSPNAKSLTTAVPIVQHTQANTILAIDNPRNDLPNSTREVNAAIAHFPQSTVLRHGEATVERVRSLLAEASIVHFSCHGTANLTDPLTSGLQMSNGTLTLKDIFALNLSESSCIRLAILSACETGLQGTKNADEAISLPTGLLQAGIAAAIASLWSVSDLSTMILLARFYERWRKEGLEPAVALRQAQQWVRDTTSQQKAKYFQETHPDIYHSLILLAPGYFAHPFHWAAFSYVGV